jgi:hypothetical protein
VTVKGEIKLQPQSLKQQKWRKNAGFSLWYDGGLTTGNRKNKNMVELMEFNEEKRRLM